jgi:hypothetical protein
MDQTTAQTHLEAWEAADLAISIGKSYTIGNRQLSRADAEEVRNQRTYWTRQVKYYAAIAAGLKNPGVLISTWG